MSQILKNSNVTLIDRSNFFCKDSSCQIYYKGKLLFSDDNHLTEDGAIFQGELFKKLNLLELIAH